MQERTSVAIAALALAISACGSSTPPPVAEPSPPPAAPVHDTSAVADAEPQEPATEPVSPTPDGGAALYELDDDERSRCPLALSHVHFSVEEAPNGMALVFRSDGDDDETDRVRRVVRRWYDDLSRARSRDDSLDVPEPPLALRSRAQYSDAPGGAVVVFVPEDLEQLETLRTQVRLNARAMTQTRSCPSGVPAGIELAAR